MRVCFELWASEGGWQGGPCPPLDFQMFTKKGCFLSFEWEKSNFTTFAPPWKNVGKIPSGLPGKNLPEAHILSY